MNRVPLAERMRPTSLKDVIGQSKALDKNSTLRHILGKKEPVSLVLWGPAGVGKTTLARIIAHEYDADFIELSAVIAGKKDITDVIARARQNWNLAIRTILFIDEIHRFNKAQQDAFLPHVESGLIVLIGATTENPSFEIITPLLSRLTVIVLEPLTDDELILILNRAIKEIKLKSKITPEIIKYIAAISNGDARVALGNLELISGATTKITAQQAKQILQKNSPRYDKNGEMHYNLISAFIKSMRGGDVRATLYYMERMLVAGEDPKFVARRMIIFASEDIGLAGNGALQLALNGFQAVECIGMPEAKYILFHVATALAKSKKSRQTTDLMHQTIDLVEKYPDLAVPIHLRNAPTKLMKELDYAKDYQWQAGFKHQKGFLPDEIQQNNKTI